MRRYGERDSAAYHDTLCLTSPLVLTPTDIKEHYYYSHAQINPTRIVPIGPLPNIEPLDAAGQKRAAEQDDGANKKTK